MNGQRWKIPFTKSSVMLKRTILQRNHDPSFCFDPEMAPKTDFGTFLRGTVQYSIFLIPRTDQAFHVAGLQVNGGPDS